MAGWSDEAFCERVVKRCSELGKSQRWLLKEAQCAHDYLQTNPTHGRRIDRIARIAEVLDVDLGQMLGLRVIGEIEPDLLLIAYRVAREATHVVQQPTDELFVENMTTVYNLLLSQRESGQSVEDPDFLKVITGVLRTGAASRLRRTPRQ